MLNPRVGRFMDSGDVDGRHYVHCTTKVKTFFCTAPFHELRLGEDDVHSQVTTDIVAIETDSSSHIVN
jgi:hypothetical protein